MKKILFLFSLIFFVGLTVMLTSFTTVSKKVKAPFHGPTRSSGISGVSTSGCGGGICHGGSADNSVTLQITGLPTNPIVGTPYTLAFVVSGPNANAGFNLKASSGTLSPIAGDMSVQLMGGELTHLGFKPAVGGVITFDFIWTPSVTGPVTFTYAGNNVNGNGSTSGDVWNIGLLNTNADVLPVKITSFQGTSINRNTNKLFWKVEQEVNFKQYEVEKSCDGLNFETIGTVQPSTDNTVLKNYQFTDATVNCTSEKVFYRLKIVNINGSADYSSIVAIVSNNKEVKPFLYPNPITKAEGFIKINTGSQKAKSIKLYTTNGVELSAYTNISTIETTLELPKNIISGNYYISIYYENDVRKTISFIVK
jgi:hypothetical protein